MVSYNENFLKIVFALEHPIFSFNFKLLHRRGNIHLNADKLDKAMYLSCIFFIKIGLCSLQRAKPNFTESEKCVCRKSLNLENTLARILSLIANTSFLYARYKVARRSRFWRKGKKNNPVGYLDLETYFAFLCIFVSSSLKGFSA